MNESLKLWVYGENALFTRPEMKAERVSYDVMTPSAARGILEAIYFKPQMRWVVTGIRVLSPIVFENIKRNELKDKMTMPSLIESKQLIGASMGINIEDIRQQRASLLLKNVSYIIEAHVEVIDPHESDGSINPNAAAKHLEIFKRRARVGGYFHHPYFGCREFPVSFELLEEGNSSTPPDLLQERDKDFGLMLKDIEYVPDPKGAISIPKKKGLYSAKAVFYKAQMRDGFIMVS